MNTKISFSILLFALLFSTSMFAQKSEEIKVWGNCGMCKKVIETAAIKAGASTARWSEETKILNVSYKPKKTDAKAIQEAVAASGYDTQDVVVKDGAKKECCSMENCDHKMDCCKDGKCEKDKACCKDGKCEKGKECCKK